jgi:hypothetical protein
MPNEIGADGGVKSVGKDTGGHGGDHSTGSGQVGSGPGGAGGEKTIPKDTGGRGNPPSTGSGRIGSGPGV